MKDMTFCAFGYHRQPGFKKNYQLISDRINAGDTVFISHETSGVVLWDGPPVYHSNEIGSMDEIHFKTEYNTYHANPGDTCLILDISYTSKRDSRFTAGWVKVLWKEKILYTWISFYGESWLTAA